MIERQTELWSVDAQAHVITTNGDINRFGQAVMGRGCAVEAKSIFPGIATQLAESLELHGNHVRWLGQFNMSRSGLSRYDPPRPNFSVFSFPVKHHWHEDADIELIERSARELVAACDEAGLRRAVAMPRPGCGNGRLDWNDVRKVIEPILDGRFVVVHK